ncbi:unnamed protein product [Brachionus calyciflorus]|uniref:Oxidized purine nucleoside triphosphate hydrolase n=1 Tax=Brachionus calyciflorus TaxID=104777 RepID=A0A813N071_9BILA|nr:unnamed protein product [Brachionus calyciflorus]
MDFKIKRIYSLVFVKDTLNKKILLGYKKRGFGKSKWIGLGGKLHPDESIIECAIREVKEEANIELTSVDKIGYLEYIFEDETNVMAVHVFSADSYSGEISETEEIRPEWFEYGSVPFDKMWPDDRYWFHLMLSNKRFKGHFLYEANLENIKIYDLSEVDNISDI